MKILFIDCEGPLTLNDNAFELCRNFLPEGENFFKLISTFDDYLAYVIEKKDYTAGGTLKLIVPFLKAYNLTNKKIEEYSKKTLRLVPGIKDTLKKLKSFLHIFIISTSYTPYIQALCQEIDFPLENTFSTSLDLDSFSFPPGEEKKLRILYRKIITLNLSPPSGKKILPSEEKETLNLLQEIFFKEIGQMETRILMEKVCPVGGKEKERAIKTTLKKTGKMPQDAVYIGDSITDREALSFLKKEKGGSISFNGNVYALKEAEFSCISSHAYPLLPLMREFEKRGRDALLRIALLWPDSLPEEERKKVKLFAPESIFSRITDESFSSLLKKSETMRKKLRGEKIGALG